MASEPAPARRRRHARTIAFATALIGECSSAALDVYIPIAEAPPAQQNVPVHLWRVRALAEGLAERFDAAAAEDADRWPVEAAREAAEDEQCFHRRCVALEAERIVREVEFGPDDTSEAPGTVRLPGVPQLATMALVGASADFLDALDRDPAEALELIREHCADGGLTPNQILDDALHTAVLGVVLLLNDAARQEDPSLAAEGCLGAARQCVRVVSVASMDLDDL
ncbi:hypothetical protein ABZ383_26465 [Streptomyces sp. NPDC005900]|uniref:hypothetical protein n=1 Tax=Streptomyces sp. NPDC005900 TaxID=3154569 RepID=UPI003405F104